MSITDVDQAFLVFDGDCAFCSSSARWLAATGIVTVRPWQSIRGLSAYGLTQDAVLTEVHWIVDGQRICGGADAVCSALIQRGGLVALVGRLGQLAAVRPAAGAVYRWVARNRYRLPGGTPACALTPPTPGA